MHNGRPISLLDPSLPCPSTFITGLPLSGDEQYTAVLVIIDILTEFATIPTTYNELDPEGFAKLFVGRVAKQLVAKQLVAKPFWAAGWNHRQPSQEVDGLLEIHNIL